MKKSIWRGALVVAAVGALTVGLVPAASAAQAPAPTPDPTPPFTIDIQNVSTYRIAGPTRIQTAIKAAQSRAWGNETGLVLSASVANSIFDGVAADPTKYVAGDTFVVYDPTLQVNVVVTVEPSQGESRVDIFLARDNDFADALVATPYADLLTAPVLLNPTDSLNSDVADEISSLANSYDEAHVHILGGVNALSQDVQDSANAILQAANPGQATPYSWRYQGVNRYQTAVNIGEVTANQYIAVNNVQPEDLNAYLTTGLKFPDALSAGAAAAHNYGVVLLTAGDEFDSNPSGNSFTYDALSGLNGNIPSFTNNNKIYAVGGPAVVAANNAGVNLAASYDGVDRYETATLTADATFDTSFAGREYFAVTSGLNYPDAVVASAYIANADGPLLLSKPDSLTAFTASYLGTHATGSDVVFTFGGPDTLSQNVTQQIEDLLNF